MRRSWNLLKDHALIPQTVRGIIGGWIISIQDSWPTPAKRLNDGGGILTKGGLLYRIRRCSRWESTMGENMDGSGMLVDDQRERCNSRGRRGVVMLLLGHMSLSWVWCRSWLRAGLRRGLRCPSRRMDSEMDDARIIG